VWPLRRLAQVAGLTAALVIYGNAKSFWDLVVLQSSAAGSTFGVGAGIALVLTILVGALLLQTDLAKLGLSGGSLHASLRLGVLIGGTLALASAVLIVGGSLAARKLGLALQDFTPSAEVPWGPLLWRAILLIWVDTVIPEELAFRGALLLALHEHHPASIPSRTGSYRSEWLNVVRVARRPAVLISSLAFAAWHIVVVLQDGEHNLPTVLGKLALIGVGGIVFCGLRLTSGNLLAPVVGHWLFDMVSMIAARFAVAL
jgi:membrane protease YdiL (CAAX protease family)